MKDLVSIITPVFNSENYLEECIESVLSQGYQNWELIIVDDFSKDNSRVIIKKYLRIDNRIKLIALEKNMGVSAARNAGIKNSSGKYIAFLDSDDLWHPNKLSTQINIMKTNNYYFTFTSFELIDSKGLTLNKIRNNIPDELNYNKLLHGNPIGCLTVVLDREKVGDITFPKIHHEDYATWLKITKNGIKAYGIKENLGKYRKSSNSLSSNKFKAVTWTWNIYRKEEKLGIFDSMYFFYIHMVKASIKKFK